MGRVRPVLLLALAAAIILASQAAAYLRQGGAGRPALVDRPSPQVAMAFWQGRIDRQPRAYLDYTYLAEAYIREARSTGDLNDYAQAEEALKRALDLNPAYPQANLLLAGVQTSFHNFPAALELATPFLSNPRTVTQALSIVGDAHLALGNYAEAEAAYDRLSAAGLTSSPAISGRRAILADLHGRSQEALSLLQQAADFSWESGDYAENIAWYEYLLGSFYFRTGDLRRAEAHYLTSLEVFDGYYLGLAGLAQVRAAQGRVREAIQLYAQAPAAQERPDLLAVLGDIYAQAGESDEAERIYLRVEAIGERDARGRNLYVGEMARFLADHDRQVEVSLALAMKDVQLAQDIYAYDTLAWALYKNGRFQEASESMDQAMRLGTLDPRLYFHAGMIQLALGDRHGARVLLEQALSINPYFDLLGVHVAQTTLEQLKDH